jgi:hypothetical protein
MDEEPQKWDAGWYVSRIQGTNWAILYNGRIVEEEFTSERNALDSMYVWESEMTQQWGLVT